MTQLPSLERWALLPFWGFSYPNLLLVFLNLLFLGTCIICFLQVLDFLWVFFILLEVRTVFNVKTTTTTILEIVQLIPIFKISSCYVLETVELIPE